MDLQASEQREKTAQAGNPISLHKLACRGVLTDLRSKNGRVDEKDDEGVRDEKSNGESVGSLGFHKGGDSIEIPVKGRTSLLRRSQRGGGKDKRSYSSTLAAQKHKGKVGSAKKSNTRNTVTGNALG